MIQHQNIEKEGSSVLPLWSCKWVLSVAATSIFRALCSPPVFDFADVELKRLLLRRVTELYLVHYIVHESGQTWIEISVGQYAT